MQVLVLEASTSAAKALVYDEVKGVLAVESESYTHEIDAGGVHDAHQVFLATMRVGKKIAAGYDIAAVATGGVWHSIMALDQDMKPVSRAYLWNFTGTAAIARAIRDQKDKARDIYRATGCMPNSTYQPYGMLFMKQNGVDFTGRFFASQAGYNFFKLTGERLETRNIMSGMGFLNAHTLTYDAGIMDLCGIESGQLGHLVDYKAVRPLTRSGARLLGISSGVPVVPPHADGALNQLGNGCMAPGRMTFSVGTSAAIRLSTDKPVLSDPPATWCYVGVEGWLSGAATNGACNCVNWFKETFLNNKWSWAELEEHLLEPGRSPVFLPFIFGERCPGWEDTRRGGFQDINASDAVPAMFRGVAEGVLFNIYQCYQILTQLSSVPDRVILSGGILNSRDWVQMAADIFQRELALSDNAHASMLGGAALALNAAGVLDDLHGFGDQVLEKISPRPEAAAPYQRKFARYMECYAENA